MSFGCEWAIELGTHNGNERTVMAFKYAVFSVMMPEYTVEQAAKVVADLGYQGVEWRIEKRPVGPVAKPSYWRDNPCTLDTDNIADDARAAKRICDEHGLAIPVFGTYLQAELLDKVEKVMRAARDIGCPAMRVQVPGYNGKENYNTLLDRTCGNFTQVAAMSKALGVKALVEIHMNTICPSPSATFRLVSRFDPAQVGVIFDAGNMTYEGRENWQMTLELLGPYLAHVHAKNGSWQRKADGRWQWAMARLDEGIVHWPEVLALLDKFGYGGWISAEDFSEGVTLEKLRHDLDHLRKSAPSH
jgi:sugar phosphate isomerase/epimerase